jgi:glycerol kinase
LFNLRDLAWDAELLELFGVPASVLPEVVPSSGVIAEGELLGTRLPIAGMAGDQQAALFGQACLRPGQGKVTYGTGSFVLVNTGEDPGDPREGLVQTVAWQLGSGAASYALEGSVFVTGAALQWLRDGLGLIGSVDEAEELARSVDGTEGVYFVPALTGLGSPHWAPEARGLIAGLHRGVRREHLVRAALEAIAYQVRDVLDAMETKLEVLRADGGGAANRFLAQLQADVARIPVEVPEERETTALGAAALAGLGLGLWSNPQEVADAWRLSARYEPRLPEEEAERLVAGWRAALMRALPQD